MKVEKLISIGMPVYNGEARIRGALDSLLGQSYSNFELFISDDASTDNTPKICEAYRRKDKRIRYIRQRENIGLVKNFNFVLEKAEGEYFMWAAQDDWWERTFAKRLAEALDQNPGYGVAMSHFRVYREGKREPEAAPGGEHNFTSLGYSSAYKTILEAKSNPIFEYGLWRREFLQRLFRRLKPPCIEDTIVLMSEAALATRFYSVPEFLYVKYRNPEPLRARHRYLGEYYSRPCPYTNFLWTMLKWHVSSPVIPARRKPLIFLPWLSRAWQYKRKIFREVGGSFRA